LKDKKYLDRLKITLNPELKEKNLKFKTIVRSEHLNHHGVLFGGYMLLWTDEFAYVAALEDYPKTRFVTRGMESVSFTKSVPNGAIVTFDVNRIRTGNSSVTYQVDVTAREMLSEKSFDVFHTRITLCAVNAKGEKVSLESIAEKN